MATIKIFGFMSVKYKLVGIYDTEKYIKWISKFYILIYASSYHHHIDFDI